jgi:predicted ATPase
VGGFAAGPAGGVHGLVRALTTFIGRTTELDELVGLLAEHPMVTVTGPGGVGKTRLAGEVARQAAARFADGAWVVELASVQDQALVPAAVAAGLALPQVSGVPVMESLVAALTRQQMLLVLDNCEHVLEGVAQLCGALLPFADEVRVLATSREPVRVPGEVRYRLRPLEVPAPGDLSGAAGSPAVVMFTDRARQNDPGFSLDGDSEPAVARLVARLDGMPLAIELAAARLEALGLTQLLERLEESFRLLTGGDRAAVPRQRSLAATVDWSYRLLDEDERRVFRRLASFPGPFTLDAAAAVAGPASAVLHLVDCSLVIPPRTGPDGRVRYLMLQTLRAFGLERLEEEGEHQEAAAALAQYAVRVAERACGEMKTSTGEVAAARWLDAEDANLQQALPCRPGGPCGPARRQRTPC